MLPYMTKKKKKDFADGIKNHELRDYSELSEWALNAVTIVLRRERQRHRHIEETAK